MITPFAGWLQLAVKTSEMMLASGQVIGHRVGRMAVAGANPSAADRREFTLMGTEKVAAASASSAAMTMHLFEDNLRIVQRVFNAQLGIATAFASLAMSQNAAQRRARQAALSSAIRRQPMSPSTVAQSATKLARLGLAPIHAAATANSRRLKKR
jgi:hypothetical protein